MTSWNILFNFEGKVPLSTIIYFILFIYTIFIEGGTISYK